MGFFGWSYPAGCSGPPDPAPNPKSEEAWAIMEAAGVDESVIESVCKIIEDLATEAGRECPRCAAAWARDEQKAQELPEHG